MIIFLYAYILIVAVLLGIFGLASLVLSKHSLYSDTAYHYILSVSVMVGLILLVSLLFIFSQNWSIGLDLGFLGGV